MGVTETVVGLYCTIQSDDVYIGIMSVLLPLRLIGEILDQELLFSEVLLLDLLFVLGFLLPSLRFAITCLNGVLTQCLWSWNL